MAKKTNFLKNNSLDKCNNCKNKNKSIPGSEIFAFNASKRVATLPNKALKTNKFVNVKSPHPIIKKGLVPEKLLKAIRTIFQKDHEFNLAKRIIHKLWNLHLRWIDEKENGTFPLSQKYKLGIINNNRDNYGLFKILEDNGIYESSSYSTARKKCKNIKLNPKLIEGKLVEINYYQFYEMKITLDSISERVMQVINKLEIPFNNLEEIHYLVKAHTFDIENRIRQEVIIDQDKILYKSEVFDGQLDDFMRHKIEAVSNKHTTLLYSLLNLKNAYCGRNDTNRRMDHPLTRVPSIYLDYFKMSGENLAEIDFKNCQPCLLAHLFKMVLKKESWIYKIPYIDRLLNNYEIKKSNHSLFSELENIVCHPNVQEFCSQCFKGTIYESINEPNAPKETRNDAKTRFILAMYGKYWNVEHSDKYGSIRNIYPKILETINILKKIFAKIHFAKQTESLVDKRSSRIRKKQKTANEAGSDELSILLQVLESYLFIDIVLPKLLDEGLDVIPRHDSFLMKESDSTLVLEITTQTFDQLLGKAQYSLRTKRLNLHNY